MSVPLYGRKWALAITTPGTQNALEFRSAVTSGAPLRFAFQIDRTLHSDSNKAKFTLSNLTREHRGLIGPGSTVVLRAGYDKIYDIVFRGTVATVTNNIDGGEVVTEIDAGDGEIYLQTSHVHLSYKSTVTLARVLQDICKRLTLTINGQTYTYSDHIVQRVPRVTLGRRAISGPVKTVLNELLHPLGMSWSIQCGTLIIQNDQGIINLSAQVLSAKTGLIGTPSKTKTGLTIRSLLLPTIAPGLAVQLESQQRELNGNYRIVSAKYAGDTHGAEWSVEAEAQPLTYPLAFYVKETSQEDFDAAQQGSLDLEDFEGAEAME
jgi:hypothetical protein